MNLKETIISSTFAHLIIFLVMIAWSGSASRFSGEAQNFVSVDLTADQEKVLQKGAKETPPHDSEAQSDAEAESALLEDRAVEPEVVQEKVEAPAEQLQTETIVNPPVPPAGFTSLEAYYQFIMLHKQIFSEKAGARVHQLLGEAFKTNTRVFYGGKGIVTLTYGQDGKLKGVAVHSDSENLKAFLEEIVWDTMPAPAAYLGHTVHIEFTVLEGYMNTRILL